MPEIDLPRGGGGGRYTGFEVFVWKGPLGDGMAVMEREEQMGRGRGNGDYIWVRKTIQYLEVFINMCTLEKKDMILTHSHESNRGFSNQRIQSCRIYEGIVE